MTFRDRFSLVDTHVDLPQTLRVLGRKPMDEIDKLAHDYPGHADLINLVKGKVEERVGLRTVRGRDQFATNEG